MDPELWLWAATAVGGAAFLGSGVLIGRSGREGRAAELATHQLERTLEGGEERPAGPSAAARLEAALAETEHLRAELRRADGEVRRLQGEGERLSAELGERGRAVEAARGELAERERAVEAVRRELAERERAVETLRRELASAREQQHQSGEQRNRLEAATERQRSAENAAREALARAAEKHDEVEQGARKLRELEAGIEALRSERLRWQERERDLERRLAAQDPELEKTLRHDLTVARETGRSQEEKAQRLEEDNGALRAELKALTARVAELAALERENAELRVRAMVGEAKAPSPRPGPAGTADLAGRTLQNLVDRVGGLDSVRSAVVADELGLVVASHGAHGDELAAIGALFARSGSVARKVLPLDQVQRLVLEDERNISVTVRPLGAYDAKAGDAELTLVTLAVGDQPDAGQMARILSGEVEAGAQLGS